MRIWGVPLEFYRPSLSCKHVWCIRLLHILLSTPPQFNFQVSLWLLFYSGLEEAENLPWWLSWYFRRVINLKLHFLDRGVYDWSLTSWDFKPVVFLFQTVAAVMKTCAVRVMLTFTTLKCNITTRRCCKIARNNSRLQCLTLSFNEAVSDEKKGNKLPCSCQSCTVIFA